MHTPRKKIIPSILHLYFYPIFYIYYLFYHFYFIFKKINSTKFNIDLENLKKKKFKTRVLKILILCIGFFFLSFSIHKCILVGCRV